MKQYSVCAIICAAGQGQRAGFTRNKLLTPFMGSTALEKTLSAFDVPAIDEIIVTASEKDFSTVMLLLDKFPKARVVLGGETRLHSVHAALQSVSSDIVLIHDGARPFVTHALIEGCIESVKTQGSGVCAIPTTDTIAYAENGKITSVPKRETLVQVQTPQGFFTENIRFAYERAIATNRTDFTDDSSIFYNFCGTPCLCKGARENVKLTYKEDFQFPTRVGFGIDTHAFGKEQDFILLAGVKIPSQSGLVAHSDGDVLAHAVMDALLSAAGLKDIGHHFPDTDERWRGANSMQMLEQVLALIKEQGFAVKNVSIAIQAEKPRLAKYIGQMKEQIATALNLNQTAVGITAGTNEKLGYVGEGKGITTYATVLLRNL